MATVTIAKPYFDALLRRGEFNSNGSVEGLRAGDGITISQAEYSQLTRQSREYGILRNALLRGGLDQSTLDVLISGANADAQEHNSVSLTGTCRAYTTVARPAPGFHSVTQLPAQIRPGSSEECQDSHNNGFHSKDRGLYTRSYSFGAEESTTLDLDKAQDLVPDDAIGTNGNSKAAGMSDQDQRTLLLGNLPERTTHAEITPLIKGGRLLDIYVRNDRTAIVSFVEGAADFLTYAKKMDIYLRSKRLEVKWHDRQFRLPAHVAHKITVGATRNLAIRNGLSRELTEQGIRDDLEHIHNLVVISVCIDKKSGDIYISTNSVHNALFARTCMMSRSVYKGLKIEWYPDECAVPVPKVLSHAQTAPASLRGAEAKKLGRPQARGNLFALLASDGADDDDSSTASEESVQRRDILPYVANGARMIQTETAIAA